MEIVCGICDNGSRRSNGVHIMSGAIIVIGISTVIILALAGVDWIARWIERRIK
jgi:hypothetical protein